MHILIIPSLLYQTEYMPLSGIFQKHQADCLAGAGHQVGVLSAGLLPFKCVFMKNRYSKPVPASEGGISVVRRYGKAYLPQRYLKPALLMGAMVQHGMEAFGRYVELNGRPDVLHAHDCLYGGVLALRLKEKYGVPYVLTEHSTGHLRGIYTPEQDSIIRSVLAGADAVSTVGSGTLRVFREKFADAAPVRNATLLYNLLDKSFEESAIPSVEKEPGKFVFLNVANLVEQKSQLNLIRAVPKVLERHRHAVLRIGGAGPMKPQLEQAITELNLGEKVSLLGLLNRGQVMHEMASCDAFVLSSRVETFGVVLIEAMAMGKPVVSTICGGPEDFVDGQSGYLMPANDVDALADAMVKMAENAGSFEPDAVRRHCIERFGREAFLKRLEGIYRQAIHSHE